MKEVASMFEAMQASNLIFATEQQLREMIPALTDFYDELSEHELVMEIPRLRRHLRAAQVGLEEAKGWSAQDVLAFIAEWDFLESLPTLPLSLQLFPTMCVSVASCERSFSKLKLINYLRSTVGQSRLSDLAVLSIESDFAKDIDFDGVTDNFVCLKSRKGRF